MRERDGERRTLTFQHHNPWIRPTGVHSPPALQQSPEGSALQGAMGLPAQRQALGPDGPMKGREKHMAMKKTTAKAKKPAKKAAKAKKPAKKAAKKR
jgi:hypothetical protein